MKYLLALFVSFSAVASDCNVEPLRKQITEYYLNLSVPVTGSTGDFIGIAKFFNVRTTGHVLLAKYESFIVITADLSMDFNKNKETVAIISNVDTATCTIESFNSGDLFGSSLK